MVENRVFQKQRDGRLRKTKPTQAICLTKPMRLARRDASSQAGPPSLPAAWHLRETCFVDPQRGGGCYSNNGRGEGGVVLGGRGHCYMEGEGCCLGRRGGGIVPWGGLKV